MIDAASWLSAQTDGAPEGLRSRMFAAVDHAAGASVQDALAHAALACLQDALRDPRGAHAALHLLAADALLTHACAAAAQAGEAELLRFSATMDAARFQLLLDGTV